MPPVAFERFSAPARIQRLTVLALFTLLLVVVFQIPLLPRVPVPSLRRTHVGDQPLSESEYYRQWGPFEPMTIPGFVNTGLPGKRSCDALKYNSTVGVQKSFFLTDDIRQIAMTLDSHPIVDYPDDMIKDPSLRASDMVERTWARLSGSSVWLPAHQVYLSVTRVIFCPSRTRSVPKMSFLRGQLFDRDWAPLDSHTLTWADRQIQFPTIFDIPAQWEPDGSLYGPEDPRIILEDGIDGAEPVIIFNMIGRRSDWKRAMYLFRPFTNTSTILTIVDQERQYTEKNWAPFFVPQYETPPPAAIHRPSRAPAPAPTPSPVRRTNEYIHFVYSFKPLRILKCHLRCGDCEFAYEQQVPVNFVNAHNEDGASLRGGTNFVPVPLPAHMAIRPDVRVYAAFPRTNIERHCGGSFYRPEFVVMVQIGSQFHLAFASESLDFGNAIIELGPDDDRCDKGRILIPNSVAHWDTGPDHDVMSVTFSVGDETVQVARVQGLLDLVLNLPQFKNLFNTDGPLLDDQSDLLSMLSSWVGDDVRGCLVEAALNYTQAAQAITHPHDHQEAGVDLTRELMYKIHQEEAEERKALATGGDVTDSRDPDDQTSADKASEEDWDAYDPGDGVEKQEDHGEGKGFSHQKHESGSDEGNSEDGGR